MRYLKNKAFQRDLKDNHLDDKYIKEVLEDVFKGRAVPLGLKMYKIRAAKEGQGKSGGFRNIFFWKRDELIIFCVLFGKNEQDNLTSDEKKALKILSDEYDQLTGDEIKTLIKNNKFKEINYDR
ncbi:MAG: type II toxin-antitoxin system RelE/ParE family toxin [Candidatus Omnitrophica bacterium]|nr:type II toxin-antitoxin system RelE/ParE family toxin [Candidatus Omnitrophota bacterium]